jgi:hypothetical protein
MVVTRLAKLELDIHVNNWHDVFLFTAVGNTPQSRQTAIARQIVYGKEIAYFSPVDKECFHTTDNESLSSRRVTCSDEGIGEIGIIGVGAAIAKYRATGRRIRDLPLTLDKVMA